MSNQINELLRKLCRKLSGGHLFGEGSLNYVVNVKLFHTKISPSSTEIQLIKNLIPDSVVGEIRKSNLFELIFEINKHFEFVGDELSHPNKKYLLSKEFKDDLDKLSKELRTLFAESSDILKFWLEEGHPFYPVYWDYAFLIRKTDDFFVLIGSSSD